MNYRAINIINDVNHSQLTTEGLSPNIEKEITISNIDNQEGQFNLIKYLIDYILDENPKIKADETINYGLWLLKFTLEKDRYSIHELDEDFQNWVVGASNAVYYYEMQTNLCNSENAMFSVPKFVQLIAISDGVLEGMPVQGIRYEEPEHMSGWYLTTKKYDGKVSSMNVVPIQDLVVKRKDLVQFLALPPGFLFETFEDYTCNIRKSSNLETDINSN